MKITKKIVGYKVNSNDTAEADSKGSQISAIEPEKTNVIQMHETLQRPDMLIGSTYKLKVPEHVSPHAMYITINDIVLNEGSEHEHRRPFEVFINSKNLDHHQWIVALTRIMSAVFRKGGDVTFLVEELRSVFDPRGGYWNNGSYMPSIIAEIGEIIERHLITIGMLKSPEVDDHKKQLIEEKKAELAAEAANPTESGGEEAWMANASMCIKCNQKAVLVRDGCQTCMNCGESKCG